MERVRAGDLEQLSELFERHHRRLYQFFLKLARDRSVAEDLVQEVFVRVLKYRHTWRDEAEFVPWMFALARNAAVDRETPVQEQVSLREEHVSVERRPVDRSATDGDNLFRERTIEAEERAEEAVVAKDARVKEELVLRKGVEHRTETFSDKVRKTEVEIEDERGQALRSGERKTTR